MITLCHFEMNDSSLVWSSLKRVWNLFDVQRMLSPDSFPALRILPRKNTPHTSPMK